MSVADKAISSLSAIPFHDILAGPLNACVEAQAQAALSTVNFIKEVGLTSTTDPNTKATVTEAVYVHFTFIQGGRKVNISVPLLTIVPIPYIAIDTIDIAFKCSITGVDTTSDTVETSDEKTETKEESSSKGLGILRKKKTSKMTTTVSSKRDSKSTQDSSYSIESTIDINLHATQDSMPGGMAKILELLNSAVELCLPDGELTISETYLELKKDEKAYITVSYKTAEGLLEPNAISVSGIDKKNLKIQNGAVVCTITGAETDKEYKVTVAAEYDKAKKYSEGSVIKVRKII